MFTLKVKDKHYRIPDLGKLEQLHTAGKIKDSTQIYDREAQAWTTVGEVLAAAGQPEAPMNEADEFAQTAMPGADSFATPKDEPAEATEDTPAEAQDGDGSDAPFPMDATSGDEGGDGPFPMSPTPDDESDNPFPINQAQAVEDDAVNAEEPVESNEQTGQDFQITGNEAVEAAPEGADAWSTTEPQQPQAEPEAAAQQPVAPELASPQVPPPAMAPAPAAPVTPPPAAKAPKQRGAFMRFMNFDSLVSTTIIKIVYILGALMIALGSLGTILASVMGNSVGNLGMGSMAMMNSTVGAVIMGAFSFVLGEILWRVLCEGLILMFSIHEHLVNIDHKLDN